ncbi:MAG TPA: protein-disulfide reductase DsbD, partial [Gammaproteobacteria bacterium]|nr:protein-disulfide reductase DsbD [Gammaproteobacteria bacterium]
FVFKASEDVPGIIDLHWEIADGYYLYRDKFKFKPSPGLIFTNPPEMPPGKVKKDPNFGDVEIYHGKIDVKLPYKFESGNQAQVEVIYQGCAELGVCYPPQRKVVAVEREDAPLAANTGQAAASSALPGAGSGSSSSNPFSRLSRLTGGLGGDEPELLPNDQAFAFNAELSGPDRLVANWVIAPGYHLYKDRIKAALESSTGLKLGKGDFPKGEMEDDLEGGLTEVFRGPLRVEFPILGLKQSPGELGLKISYQGCADAGVCYPPVKKALSFDAMQLARLGKHAATSTPAEAPVAVAPVNSDAPPAVDSGKVSSQDAITERLASGNMLLTLLAFLGFGLLLSLTPCVFPMIPILSGIIVGQGEKITTGRSFMLSVAYVLAMAAVYALVGVIAGMTGANLQVMFQNPYVLVAFALVFVVLALSLFGFFELQMPASIQSRLTNVSNKQRGGSLVGAAIMGVLSALIVGPCVTAPLMGALVYISQTGDAVLGGMALFVMGLGMGVPLLLIGLSAGSLLPRAGVWMDAVKSVFGVMMLGVAIWFLERILPPAVSMFLWAFLLILSGVYMGAFHGYGKVGHKLLPLWKGSGLVLIVWGVLILIGIAAGGNDVLQPLKGVAVTGQMTSGPGSVTSQGELPFRQIKGEMGLDDALAEARTRGKVSMLDFNAEWCATCKELEKYTFADPAVHDALRDVVLLSADVTENDATDKALMKRFGIIGPPAIMFFDTDGNELKAYRVVGFMEPAEFRAHVLEAKKQ